MISNTEQTFYNHWLNNLEEITKLNRQLLTECYFFLYENQYEGFLDGETEQELYNKLSAEFERISNTTIDFCRRYTDVYKEYNDFINSKEWEDSEEVMNKILNGEEVYSPILKMNVK